MKTKIFLLLATLLLNVGASAQQRGFRHPGGMHSQEDFERVKQQIADKEPTVLKAYNALVAWGKSNTDTGPGATEYITRGSTNNTGNTAYRVKLAYKYALLWKLTGETKYADISINILNTWARTCKGVNGDTNAALASGLQGYQFAQVGELMRDYEGWKAEDFKAFQQWMLKVFYKGNAYFLYIRNGCNPGAYWSNWGLCNALSMMSIGILCDDVYLYNMGVGFFKYDQVPTNPQCKIYKHDEWWDYNAEPYRSYTTIQETSDGEFRDNGYNEYLGNLVMKLHEDERGVDIYGDGTLWLGQMQELGRDQGHNNMSVGVVADICQSGWSQGDDLWSWMGNRLAAGIEETALYNADESAIVPYTRYHYRQDNKVNNYSDYTISGAASGSRGQYRPIWHRVVSHYEGIKGIKMVYSRKMAAKGTANMDEYSGVDHLGFTHLMSIIPARTDGLRPVYLEPYIETGGVRLHKSGYDNLGGGASIKLSVEIPDSMQGGTWSWDMGDDTGNAPSTTNILEIQPSHSNIYRVSYAAPNGTTSTQLFSIGVHGDCYADAISKHFYVSHPTQTDLNGWKENDVITVYAGSSSTLSCQAGTNTGTWRYFTKDGNSSEITLPGNITLDRDTVVYIEYTNMGGGVTLDSVKFVMAKEQIVPTYCINGGSIRTGSAITCSTGDNVELIPTYSKAQSWLWDTGEDTQSLTIADIHEGGKHTVSMINTDGEELTQTYDITIYDLNLINPGDTIAYKGKQYVLGSNLIKNWTFDDGLADWYDGTMSALITESNWIVNTEGGVDGNWLQGKVNTGKATEGALGTAWEIQDSIYYFGFCTSVQKNLNDAADWQKVSVTNEKGTETVILFGSNGTKGNIQAVNGDEQWRLNDVIYDNTKEGYKYIQCCFRWQQNGALGFDHFVLAPLREVKDEVNGIANIHGETDNKDNIIFDLCGRRIPASAIKQKGIYIINGIKVVIK